MWKDKNEFILQSFWCAMRLFRTSKTMVHLYPTHLTFGFRSAKTVGIVVAHQCELTSSNLVQLRRPLLAGMTHKTLLPLKPREKSTKHKQLHSSFYQEVVSLTSHYLVVCLVCWVKGYRSNPLSIQEMGLKVPYLHIVWELSCHPGWDRGICIFSKHEIFTSACAEMPFLSLRLFLSQEIMNVETNKCMITNSRFLYLKTMHFARAWNSKTECLANIFF